MSDLDPHLRKLIIPRVLESYYLREHYRKTALLCSVEHQHLCLRKGKWRKFHNVHRNIHHRIHIDFAQHVHYLSIQDRLKLF